MNVDKNIALSRLLKDRIDKADEMTRDYINKNIDLFFTKTSPDDSSGLAKLINEVKK